MRKSLSDYYSSIFIHLGAHRTGTSRLQKYLLEVQTKAGSQHYDFVVPQVAGQREQPDHRNFIKKYLKQHARFEKKYLFFKIFESKNLKKIFDNYVEFLNPKSKTLVMSEENFLGQAFYAELPGTLYPEAERNLRAVRSLIGLNIEKIFLSIRPYPDFLISYDIMREAYFNRGIGLANLSNWAHGEILGWQKLVEVVRTVFPNTVIEIWPYGDITIERQFSRLTGDSLSKVAQDLTTDVINASATFEALELLQERRKTGLILGKEDVDKILKSIEGRKIGKKDVFSLVDIGRLSKLYLSELEAVSKMSNVIVFRDKISTNY
ncbi:hypothetical protein [Roseibium aggregatum]|uniref:hypothetical protein n=1 Tax=Roseibium aggregatum TaxID=187304 RepID=UPI003A97A3C7